MHTFVAIRRLFGSRSWPVRAAIVAAVSLAGGVSAWAIVTDLTIVKQVHTGMAEHSDQAEIKNLVATGQDELAFETAFEEGDELFETEFNAIDGGGARVGAGQRYTRVPRADLAGAGEWKRHFPARATGPNAAACNDCHNQPEDDGAGPASANVHRDPQQSALLGRFIQRNTPHLFGVGGVQRLAEEMTDDLKARLATARSTCRCSSTTASSSSCSATVSLSSKGVSFGSIKVTRAFGSTSCVTDTSQVQGVAADLVVRPFQWKGSVAFVRDFNRGASHNELGMQSVELSGDNVDRDGDGVANEMTIGDQTTLAVYISAQPRPTTRQELAALGLIPPLTSAENSAINRGSSTFTSVGCASCHIKQLVITRAIFSEPSQNASFRDAIFPAGQNPITRGVDPAFAVTFDLTRDQPDNRITDANGNIIFRLGSFVGTSGGGAVVALLGDLKRHNIGTGLAESIDEIGTGASVFLTENLWGVGSTAPYLHDGRATTLTEAILEHGGEALTSKNNFVALSTSSKKDVIAYLENQVLFKIEEEEE